MSHVEIYKIKGRTYKYRVWNRRVGSKIKHAKKYLGPVEPVKAWKRGRKRGPGGGRKPALFARPLQENERQALGKALASGKSFTRERARVILASSAGKSVKEVASTVGKEARSVRAAIKGFNERGLLALERGKSTGRKPVFTAEQRAEVLALASTSPNSLGEAFTTWSLPKLKRHLQRKNFNVSIESIRQMLRKEKFRVKKSRKFQYSNDPDFVKKNSR